MKKYDLIVVGGGVSGTYAASEAAKKGFSVLLVEKNQIGGTCLNCGCIPSKFMLTLAEEYERINQRISTGFWKGNITYDYSILQQECKKTIDLLQNGMKNSMMNAQVDILYGEAQISQKIVTVGQQQFEGEHIILATGSSPMIPNIEGIEECLASGFVITNERVFELDLLPETLIVAGGGESGIEMAFAFALLGSKVTILEAAPTILCAFDSDLRNKVQKILQGKGIEILTDSKVLAVEDGVVCFEKEGQEQAIECDQFYCCVGRKPVLQGISDSVERIERGYVKTDQYMMTNISGIYAIGDVTGKGMLAYTGTDHAQLALDHIFGKQTIPVEKIIPQVLYLSPECVQLGVTEDQLKNEAREYYVAQLSMNFSGRFVINQNGMSPHAFVKLILDEKENLIGTQMMSIHASEMTVMFAMMIEQSWNVRKIVESVFPHPTECEIVHDCALRYLNGMNHS